LTTLLSRSAFSHHVTRSRTSPLFTKFHTKMGRKSLPRCSHPYLSCLKTHVHRQWFFVQSMTMLTVVLKVSAAEPHPVDSVSQVWPKTISGPPRYVCVDPYISVGTVMDIDNPGLPATQTKPVAGPNVRYVVTGISRPDPASP
jgi:hypothetical protein